jgi:hypothetical protein
MTVKNLFYAAGILFFLVATVLLVTSRTEAQSKGSPPPKVANFFWTPLEFGESLIYLMTEDGTLYSRKLSARPSQSFQTDTEMEARLPAAEGEYQLVLIGNVFTK